MHKSRAHRTEYHAVEVVRSSRAADDGGGLALFGELAKLTREIAVVPILHRFERALPASSLAETVIATKQSMARVLCVLAPFGGLHPIELGTRLVELHPVDDEEAVLSRKTVARPNECPVGIGTAVHSDEVGVGKHFVLETSDRSFHNDLRHMTVYFLLHVVLLVVLCVFVVA